MVVGERNYIHIFSTGEINKLHSYEVSNISLGKLILSNNTDKNVWVIIILLYIFIKYL